MNTWRRKKGIQADGDSEGSVVTKYTIGSATAKEIRKVSPEYGSQGRALQVATEMLIRMEDPPPVDEDSEERLVRVSMRLRKRTYDLIKKLADLRYEKDTGQVIAACIKVLKMKRIKI